MNKIRVSIVSYVLLAVCTVGISLSSCSGKFREGTIIFSRVTAKPGILNTASPESLKYISQPQIVALDPSKTEASIKVLTSDFFSARSPRISYDGKSMLFAGQKNQTDPWQIWEINLNNLKFRQITSSKENCTDPVYLPLGRLVFSKFSANDSLKAGHSLFVCNIDGSKVNRITFNPDTYLSSNVLSDGRILTIGKQVFPESGMSMYMVLRPDGTKSELFYKGPDGSKLSGPALETNDRKLVFVETGKNNPAQGSLVSISYNRPLHSRVNLTSEIKGDFNAVFPVKSGKLIVSYRKTESDRYGLYEFDPDTRTLGRAIYNNTESDVLEAVVVGIHERPKKLPSEVDMGVKTGLLLCQDINVPSALPSAKVSKTSQIEIAGLDSTLGSVKVEPDGSFYLKVMADKPFKIKTFDEAGNILNESCNWIWLRPNERRGCVGCHEDPEMVPENRVALAVKKPPVKIPMHINKVVEKKVSLE